MLKMSHNNNNDTQYKLNNTSQNHPAQMYALIYEVFIIVLLYMVQTK